MTLLFLLSGFLSCSSRDRSDVAVVNQKQATDRDRPLRPLIDWYDPAETRYDFGLKLAGTDVRLSHTFRLANRSGRQIQIRGVANRKPCCGDVAVVPAQILEAGQTLEVPVTLKLGLGSGSLVHIAVIEVGGDCEDVSLSTTAVAHARATVEEVDPKVSILKANESRSVSYLVHSFGIQGDLPQPLDDRSIVCDLPAKWVGPVTAEASLEADIIAVSRVVSVTLPGSVEIGRRTSNLAIRDDLGRITGRRQIRWEVDSPLVISPTGLVFGSNAESAAGYDIIVRCRDQRPFRISKATTKVAGLVVDVDDDARLMHKIHLHLHSRVGTSSQTGEVVVQTDHPDQPTITLPVYIPDAGIVPPAVETLRSSP